MKIRYGFVSNSSSTSFCILGKEFNGDAIDVDNLPSNLDYHQTHYDSSDYYVGISLTKIAKTDMTYKEFAEHVKQSLEVAGLDGNGLGIHEGGWYEG